MSFRSCLLRHASKPGWLFWTAGSKGGGIPGLEGFASLFRDSQISLISKEATIGLSAQLEARRHHDARLGLASVDSQTLVCAGQFDAIAPAANSERIVEIMPEARLEIFHGGHLFMLQDSRALTTISEFLRA